MNGANHYTDEDFQSYFEGGLDVAPESFKAHLQACPVCKNNYEAYASTWSFIAEVKTPPLSVNLAEVVTARIFDAAPVVRKSERGRSLLEGGLYGLLVCLALGCVAMCIRELMRHLLPLPWLLLLLPVLLYAGLLGKEVDAINSRWRNGIRGQSFE